MTPYELLLTLLMLVLIACMFQLAYQVYKRIEFIETGLYIMRAQIDNKLYYEDKKASVVHNTNDS